MFTIQAEHVGLRLDRLLSELPEIATRSQASRLLSLGMVRDLRGDSLKASFRPAIGTAIEVEIPVIATDHLVPLDLPLNIVHEDDDLIIVNKPAGLVVHPACGHLQDTLVNALLHHTPNLSMGFNERRPGIVHRIDKGTSGLLVVAKHDEAQRFLAKQFAAKTIHRIYWAITFGPFRSDSGKIQSFLMRHPENRKRVASVAPNADGSQTGKHAVTHYRILKSAASGLSLVELRLETGRTHQIRVHLSELGHPIVGDEVYGGMRRAKNLKSLELRQLIEKMDRFALHAAELGFTHPRSKEAVRFSAPWPEDLLKLVQLCHFERDMQPE